MSMSSLYAKNISFLFQSKTENYTAKAGDFFVIFHEFHIYIFHNVFVLPVQYHDINIFHTVYFTMYISLCIFHYVYFTILLFIYVTVRLFLEFAI